MVVLDGLNIRIIKEFYNLKEKEEISTWELTKKLFPRVSKIERRRKHLLIKTRIHSMPELFKIEKKNGLWMYELISDNVYFSRFSFLDRRKFAICVKIKDKWMVQEV